MDDVVVLAPSRKLRRAVRIVNQVLTGLRLEKAPGEATWKQFCEN